MSTSKSTQHTHKTQHARHVHLKSTEHAGADSKSPASAKAMAKLDGNKEAWYKTRIGKWIVVAATSAILIAGASAYTYFASRHHIEAAPNTSTPSSAPSETPKPITKKSSLTGSLVSPELATKGVVGVVVENLDPDARPQSGLSKAGVVYEALAEGGITRYVAFFQTDIPSDIGPVRSLRPVFYQMGMEYDAPVAHIGGSTDGLALAHSGSGFKDMDQFYNGSYFRRITSRWAPHNVYIYGESLIKMVTDKSWYSAPTFTPWLRKDDEPSSAPDATSITADFSSPSYTATFSYDAGSNSYKRSIAGKPDIDASNDNKQVNPKTVIVLYAATTAGTQPNGKPKTDIDLIGSGKALLFQDGTAKECTWKKVSDKGRLTLSDTTSGQELHLNRGQSWVSIIPTGHTATWR